MTERTVLEKILESDFNVDVNTNYESIKNFLRHPNFPQRESEFKQQLAEAITMKAFTPERISKLTDVDYETDEEVENLLVKEIWEPLYGNQSFKDYS